jgi:hypothetical protein
MGARSFQPSERWQTQRGGSHARPDAEYLVIQSPGIDAWNAGTAKGVSVAGEALPAGSPLPRHRLPYA